MKRRHIGVLAIMAALAVSGPTLPQANAAYLDEMQSDLAGASDHPLVGRYEGSFLLSQTVNAFDELALPAGPAEGETWNDAKKFSDVVTVEGQITRSLYVVPPGRSLLEIARNFRDALTSVGFEPVYECARDACGPSFRLLKYAGDRETTQVVSDQLNTERRFLVKAMFDEAPDVRYALYKKSDAAGDTYVAIFVGLNQGGTFGDVSAALEGWAGVLIEVAEPRAMERRITTVSSTEIDSKIATQGRVSFYGIYFDFDKADIKSESAPQLAEMAEFLMRDPDLKVFIVGHTDNTGDLDYNLALSQRRAEAVTQALATRYGVDAGRMMARGLGSLAPIASNRTESGRAENRRVEMVEQ